MGLYSCVIMLQLFWLALVLLHGSFTPVSTVVVKSEVVSGSSEEVEIVLKKYPYYMHKTICCCPQSQRNGQGRFREITVHICFTCYVISENLNKIHKVLKVKEYSILIQLSQQHLWNNVDNKIKSNKYLVICFLNKNIKVIQR